MICFPNAKINLGLHILSKRNDGYHNISSLLFPIPYHDVLEFLPSKTYNLTVYGTETKIPKKDNLITKAWDLMSQNYGVPNLHINLLKHIPIGSGLGGGSADASFFIVAVNQFFELNLSIAEMQEIAFQIGSDCPFFILNKPAIISGNGELTEPIEFNLDNKILVLAVPSIHISTKEAYAKITPVEPIKHLSEVITQPIETWPDMLSNDFEKSIFNAHPELEKIKHNFYKKGATYASLTGSGSAIYAVFDRYITLDSKDFDCPLFSFALGNQWS